MRNKRWWAEDVVEVNRWNDSSAQDKSRQIWVCFLKIRSASHNWFHATCTFSNVFLFYFIFPYCTTRPITSGIATITTTIATVITTTTTLPVWKALTYGRERLCKSLLAINISTSLWHVFQTLSKTLWFLVFFFKMKWQLSRHGFVC